MSAIAEDFEKRLHWVVKRLHEGSPLDSVPLGTLHFLVEDALRSSGGFFSVLSLNWYQQKEIDELREAVNSWKERAARADDREQCEHCGSRDTLTRSAVSCQECLVKIVTRRK